MALADIILQQVKNSTGGISIPSNVKDQVLGGLSQSILGGLTQTAAKPGGIDLVKNLLTGKTSAASSPVTALAGKLFAGNIASKLGLGSSLTNSLTGMIPSVLTKVSGLIKDQDGDGDIDLNDVLIALKGGGSGAGILGAATSILGGILKR